MAAAAALDVDSIIERLLAVRGTQASRQVALSEAEIRGLCAAARCVAPPAAAGGRRAPADVGCVTPSGGGSGRGCARGRLRGPPLLLALPRANRRRAAPAATSRAPRRAVTPGTRAQPYGRTGRASSVHGRKHLPSRRRNVAQLGWWRALTAEAGRVSCEASSHPNPATGRFSSTSRACWSWRRR